MDSWDVAIVGGGPAGLMAAARAAERGRKVILLEKNREPAVKILLSGGTRCNLTHATDARGIVEAFGRSGRFLHSALAALDPDRVVELFKAEGVPTKIEPGGKVFPRSDRASDVRAALVRRVRRSGGTLAMSEPIADITRSETGFRLVTAQRQIEAHKVLLATGGQSYPACGTTGDGYRWAAALGHRIVSPHTALTPITTHAPWVLALQGVTLPDVFVEVVDPSAGEGRKTKCLASRRGAMLFTHFGVSGPVILDVSHAVSGFVEPGTLLLRCDLAPDVATEALDAFLAQENLAAGKRRVASLLESWLPRRVCETLVALAGMPPERLGAEFSKAERRRLVQAVKRLDIPVVGTMGFRKAEVTAGGVSLDEVDSRTMQSKLVENLFFAGELLDLNGPVGGYNFQAAFSTGWLAGESM
jgi:predicted Rossmann fold flavoprotein